MTKACKDCGVEKDVSEFRKTANTLQPYCKPCQTIRTREWRRKNPDKVKNSKRRSMYGITTDEYEAQVVAQDGVCAICGCVCSTQRNLSVDHDHETKMVRGLLCMNCNNGLGKFKDNVTLLQNAIEYLMKGGVMCGLASN